MNLVLLGPPGAGKGTQAKRLVDKYNLVHLASGDILRAQRAASTDLGHRLAGYMDAGELVPDELVTKVIIDRIKEVISHQQADGFLLDGFPRTVTQSQELDRALEEARSGIDAVLDLCTDRELTITRLTGRRSCPACGAVYHVSRIAPKVADTCDRCGDKLVHRSDDAESVVQQRLEVYQKQTAPLEQYYQQRGLLKQIDGNMDIDQVSRQIEQVLVELAGA